MLTFSSERGKGHPESVLYVCAPSICFDVYDLEWKRKEFLKVNHYMSVLRLVVNLLKWKRKKGCPESVLYVCALSACLDVYGLKLKRKGIFESPLCVCVLFACLDVYDLDWERKVNPESPSLYVGALLGCQPSCVKEEKEILKSESALYVCALFGCLCSQVKQ